MNRDKFHSYFEEFLSQVRLDPYFIDVFREVLKRVESTQKSELQVFQETQEKSIKEIDTKIQKYIERIGKTDSEMLVESYEKQVKELEKEKNEIIKNIENIRHSVKNVRTLLEKKLKYYEKPLYFWKNGSLNVRKKLLREVFPE